MIRIILALLILAVPAHGAERSSKVRRQFQAAHPCPSTGKTTGACKLWVADHKYPLCAGGKDEVANLQWQTVEEGAIKDRVEVALCAALRKLEKREAACPTN